MKLRSQLPDNRPPTGGWYLHKFYSTIKRLFFTKSRAMVIAEQQDEFGTIRIFEMGNYRFLEFGLQFEQSCVYMPDPSWLEYDYTRAMLMGALAHPAPKSALFLGLGAGTLTTACLKHLPLEEATAIELRSNVIELAKQYLAFPANPKLTIIQGDALKHLEEQAPTDLIFLDLYTDDGPSIGHSEWSFLGLCQKKLNPNGWLIINQWALHDGTPKDQPILKTRFKNHYWECSVASGNVVLLVPQNPQQPLDLTLLEQKITALTPQLGYSLIPLFNALKPLQR